MKLKVNNQKRFRQSFADIGYQIYQTGRNQSIRNNIWMSVNLVVRLCIAAGIAEQSTHKVY